MHANRDFIFDTFTHVLGSAVCQVQPKRDKETGGKVLHDFEGTREQQMHFEPDNKCYLW